MTHNKLCFYQVNLQHCKSATEELNGLKVTGNMSIFLIQEPYLFKSAIRGFNIRKFNLIQNYGPGKPRSCIVASKNCDIMPIRQYCTDDLVVAMLRVSINGSTRKIIVASGYMSPERESLPPSADVINLVNYCKTVNLPLLLGCDANSHHTLWGSTDCNPKGHALMDFILSSNLTVLNRGDEPTFVNSVREEVLDITLCSMHLSHLIQGWYVTNKVLTSDHKCIHYYIKTDHSPRATIRIPSSTNWSTFKERLSGTIPVQASPIRSIAQLDSVAEELNKALISSFQVACPPKIIGTKRTNTIMTRDLRSLRDAVRKAFNKAKNKDPSAIATRRKLQTEYNKALRKEKRQSFQAFCTSIESQYSSAKILKSLCKDPFCVIGSLKLPNGNYTDSPESTLKHLLDTHFPGSFDPSNNPGPNFNQGVGRPCPVSDARGDLDIAQKIVSVDKISWAIKSFSPFKSPGEDGIFPAMLQHGQEILVNIVYELFIASLVLQHIPTSWRGVRVVFIPKVGQLVYTLAKSFRPISLTSFMLKTLERLIDRFLRDGVLKVYRIHPKQHAYQAGKSAEGALHQLIAPIDKALKEGKFALGGFIDLVGAFSNVTFNSVVSACKEHHIDETTAGWILKMLKSRIVNSYLGSTKVSVLVSKGCPQGGVLPPLLYILVKDSVLKTLNDMGYNSHSFADDLAVILIGKFISSLCELMQHAFALIENWCTDHEQMANPDKTKIVLFTKRRQIQGFKAPKLFGKEIHLSNSAKILGVIIDAKLNFNLHIHDRINKATATLWQCRRTFGKTWGLNAKILMWIYKSVVRPMFSYGAIIWWHRCKLVSVQNSLSKMQRLALISVTGCMRSTPTIALEAALNIEPLHIYIEEVARLTALRLFHSKQFINTEVGHASIWNSMLDECPDFEAPIDKTIPHFRFDRKFEVLIPSREEWSNSTVHCSNNGTTWFTDGSKSSTSSGAGIYCPLQGKSLSFPLGSMASIAQAETVAMIRCGWEILSQETPGRPVNICSDSQGILKALQGYIFRSALLLDCWEIMQRASQTTPITLIWIPSHRGFSGNEAADLLAREGSTTPFIGPEPAIRVPYSNLKLRITSWRKNSFKRYWDSTVIAGQSKKCISISDRYMKYFLSLSRCNLSRILGVLTGHCPLNKYLHLIGRIDSPLCHQCGEIETAEHFLCSCPAFIMARARYLGRFLIPLSVIRRTPPKYVLEFLNSTKRI